MKESEKCPVCKENISTKIMAHGNSYNADYGINFITICEKCGVTKTTHMKVDVINNSIYIINLFSFIKQKV